MANSTSTPVRLPPINTDLASKPAVLQAVTAFSNGTFTVTPTEPPHKDPPKSVGKDHASIIRDEEFDFSDDETPQPKKTIHWQAMKQNIALKTYTTMCSRLRASVRSMVVKQLEDKVERITLKRMDLPGRDIRAICTALTNYNHARELDVTGNQLKSEGVGCVTRLFSQNHRFTCLMLSENVLGGEPLKNLVKDMSSLKHLRELDLSTCQITDMDGESLEKLIYDNNTLATLILSRNELRHKAAEYIGRALGKNRCLEVLDLSWNHLRGPGAVAIGNSLLHNRSVTSLNLSWNGFSYEGCSALGHALTHNTSLTELDLSSNRVHPNALFTLLKGVCQNDSLEVLKLADNPISAVYTSPLLVKLSESKVSVLSDLDLTGIVVDDTFAAVLSRLHEQRSIQVKHGDSLPIHRTKWLKKESELADAPRIHNIDPIRLLYHTKRNLRCIDFLVNIDQDNSSDLSRNELNDVLKKNNMQISSSSLDSIMQYLDTNKDGKVDLIELIAGERKLRRRVMDMNRSKTTFERNKHSETFNDRTLTALDDTLYDLVQKADDPGAKIVN